MDSKRVIVTGATGFIGSKILDAGLRKKIKIKGLARSRDDDDYIEGNILKDSNLFDGFDTVIHCAFDYKDMDNNKRINDRVIELLGESEVEHFIYLSSVDVFDTSKTGLLSVKDKFTKSTTKYASCKIEFENELLKFADLNGIKVSIFYPPIVLGVGGYWSNYIYNLVRFENVSLPRAGDFNANIIHVDDLAKLVLSSINKSPASKLNPYRVFSVYALLHWSDVYHAHNNSLKYAKGIEKNLSIHADMSNNLYSNNMKKNIVYHLFQLELVKTALSYVRKLKKKKCVACDSNNMLLPDLDTPSENKVVQPSGKPRVAHMSRYILDERGIELVLPGFNISNCAAALEDKLSHELKRAIEQG